MTRSSGWLLLFALTNLLVASKWGQTAPLLAQEELRQPVTVRSKMLLLPELLREVSRQTGVPLTAERELAGDKLTVFVKGVSAADLLERVATIVMGEWRQTREGYQLVHTAQARRWEEELLALERENRLQDAHQTVEVYMQQAQRPYAELIQEARQKYESTMVDGPSHVLRTPGGETIRVVGPVYLPSNTVSRRNSVRSAHFSVPALKPV